MKNIKQNDSYEAIYNSKKYIKFNFNLFQFTFNFANISYSSLILMIKTPLKRLLKNLTRLSQLTVLMIQSL